MKRDELKIRKELFEKMPYTKEKLQELSGVNPSDCTPKS
jgi:hypothetical protein